MSMQDIAKVGELSPILVSVPDAATLIGRGVSTVYELIGAKKIRAKKSDNRTLVVVASLYQYAESLPDAIVARRERRKPQHLREAAAAR